MNVRTPGSIASRDRAELWQDPRHWDRFGVYRCADDPRLIVPQRKSWGWTVNMKHPRAQTVLWCFLGVVVAFLFALVLIVGRAN